MELVLRQNDHKGGWEDEKIRDLFVKVMDEVGELARAMDDGLPGEIQKECCDVANYVMMIHVLITKRIHGKPHTS